MIERGGASSAAKNSDYLLVHRERISMIVHEPRPLI